MRYKKGVFVEYIGAAIAIVSLFLSIYAVRLGRMNRSYDLLFKFFADLKLKEPKKAECIEDIIPPEPEEMDEEERFIRLHNSQLLQEQIEAKFNLLCYAVVKRQIPVGEFFALFGHYLQARMEFWPMHNIHRIGNYPYTARVIDMCIRIGMLPISKNKDFFEKRRGKLHYWKDGAKAFEAMHQDILQESQAENKDTKPK